MEKKERKLIILELFEKKESIKVSDVLEILSVDRTTVFRDLRELIGDGRIEEVRK